MVAPADVIFVDGEVHVHPGSDRPAEALAVRDGTVCRVADTYEVEFLEGLETRRVDLDGRTVIPGFADGYARLLQVGQRLRGSETEEGERAPRNVEQARESLVAAVEYALEQGITTVYDEVRNPETARAYHELALANELPIRVRLNYRVDPGSAGGLDPLEAVNTLGLVSGVGSESLRIESFGIDAREQSRTAVQDLIERATEAGFPVSVAAADGTALESLRSGLDGMTGTRPRVWFDGEPTDDQVQVLADLDATVVFRPGPAPGSVDKETAARGRNHTPGPKVGRLVAAGIPVAFGSNGALPDPLRDIERATSAGPEARLGITEAIQAATGTGGPTPPRESGVGTLEVGTPADFIVLSASPWETPSSQLDVELTVVDGQTVFESA